MAAEEEDDDDEVVVAALVGVTTVAAPTADLRTDAAAEATGDCGAAADEEDVEDEGVALFAGATTVLALELVAVFTALGTVAATAGATAAFDGGGGAEAVDDDMDLGLVAPGSTLDAVCQIAKPAADTAARTSAPAMRALEEDEGALGGV